MELYLHYSMRLSGVRRYSVARLAVVLVSFRTDHSCCTALVPGVAGLGSQRSQSQSVSGERSLYYYVATSVGCYALRA